MRIHGLRYLYVRCGNPVWGKVRKTTHYGKARMVLIKDGSYVNVEAMTFFYPNGEVKFRGELVCRCDECASKFNR